MVYYVSYYGNDGFGPILNIGAVGTKREAQAITKRVLKSSPHASPIIHKTLGRKDK